MPSPSADSEELVLTFGPEAVGRRLDTVLAEHLPTHSRAEIQRWIRGGLVAVSGHSPESLKPRLAVATGMRVRVSIPPDDPKPLAAEPLGLSIVYRDDVIVVVDKPAGMVCHPSPGHASGTLVNALLHEVETLSTTGGEERPGLVHRLDRDTTGIIVIARTDRAHRELARQFKERETEKVYLALTRGAPGRDVTRMERAIGRSRHDRKKMTCRPDGRPSETTFEVVERLGSWAFVRARPRTGRTHQIRVHLHALGAPILCDSLYAPQGTVMRSELLGKKREQAETPILTRHALHAHSLTVTHPTTGERVTFRAPLPDDLATVLQTLRSVYGSPESRD